MNMQTLLKELNDAGMSDYQIATRIQAPQSIVNRLRRGNHKSTTFERGRRIVELHEEMCIKPVAGSQPPQPNPQA